MILDHFSYGHLFFPKDLHSMSAHFDSEAIFCISSEFVNFANSIEYKSLKLSHRFSFARRSLTNGF